MTDVSQKRHAADTGGTMGKCVKGHGLLLANIGQFAVFRRRHRQRSQFLKRGPTGPWTTGGERPRISGHRGLYGADVRELGREIDGEIHAPDADLEDPQ